MDGQMDDRLRAWRPTYHSRKIKVEGRNRPPPSVGSPTMVWHLGIWRKQNHAKGSDTVLATEQYLDRYMEANDKFFGEISEFLVRLQERGLLVGVPVQRVSLEPIILEGAHNRESLKGPRRFKVYPKQSLSFVLWWRADAIGGVPNVRSSPDDPALANAFRVFVQFQSFEDHATITFYIDAARVYGGGQIHAPKDGDLGARRGLLSKHLETIRKSSHEEIVTGRVDMADQRILDNPDLDDAVRYFYVDTWDDFQSAFGFMPAPAGEQQLKHGSVFVNQRGLMMSMRGLKTPEDEAHKLATRELIRLNGIKEDLLLNGEHEEKQGDVPWRPYARSANATIGPVDVFDKKSGEPEVVLRSLWPFLSRMSPGAASKDWIGSGILEWRALHVSPLGALPQDWDQTEATDRNAAGIGPALDHEVEHFLVVTKGEPHRRQIGRMIERFLALETMRAFALKNLGVIHNSYLYLRVLTTQLDDLLQKWSTERKQLEEQHSGFRERVAKNQPAAIHKFRKGVTFNDPDALTKEEEDYYDSLSRLNSYNETRLIDIAAEIEIMGPGGSGHLAYSIDRATYIIDEFDRMVPTLEVGNIAGWSNYEQFADRGMRPTFNMIRTTGARLRSANERLKALTDVVQVSALIVQSDATRRNTGELRKIGENMHKLHRSQMWLAGVIGIGGLAFVGLLLRLLPGLLKEIKNIFW